MTQLSNSELQSRSVPAAMPGALSLAVCATFMTGSAQAAIQFFDFPDVTLGSKTIDVGGTPLYDFQGMTATGIFANFVDTLGNNAVVGRPVDLSPFLPPGQEVPPEAAIKNFATALDATAMIDGNRTDYVSSIALGSEGGTIPVILSKGLAAPKPIITGDFFDNGTAFIGLRFDLPNNSTLPHYGCVEAVGVGPNVTLTTFAYEDQAGVGILAGACSSGIIVPPGQGVPEPGTLALLVAGAAGVLALRRRQRAR